MLRPALLLACASAIALSSSLVAASENRPDIILIQLDDWGFHALGAHGASIPTPHIDRLVQEGRDFTAAHAMPLCSPTRLQMLTGLSNLRNYTTFGTGAPNARTFATDLKAAGYATAMVGKWHTGGPGASPNHYGFQFVRLAPKSADSYAFTAPDWLTTPLAPGTYQPDLLQAQVMTYLKAPRQQPALLYYAMRLPHYPWNPPPGVGNPSADDPKYYAAMVTYADKQIGEIVEYLRTSGRAANTLLLVTGDNGNDRKVTVTMKNGQKITGQKGTLRDGATHVPLIAWWPGTIAAGSTCADLIDCADIYPTLCAIGGTTWPRNLDAVSFAPQLRGQPGTPRAAIYGWFDGKAVYHDRGEWARNKRWKLFADGKLYDVIADPMQSKPVAPSPEANAARATLQAVLDAMPNRPWGAPPTGVPPESPPPTPTLNAPGTSIGAMQQPGTAVVADNGTWTVSARGTDIWGTADAFHFVSQPLTGDGTITARVVSLSNTHAWAKAGVMIRSGLAANAAHAMTVVTPGNGVAFQHRRSAGQMSAHTAGSRNGAPRWVRLTRAGNRITGAESTDGETWTDIGFTDISMADPVRVGLCITSHQSSATATAVFTDVAIVPSGGG